MPAWFSHAGILIINRLGKKKRFDGMCLVVGSLVPDLEFIPQVLLTILTTRNMRSIFQVHMQGLFHSLLGLIITVPLTIAIAYVLRGPTKSILIKSRIAKLFKFKNLDVNTKLCCWSLKNSISSAIIGVISAIFLDFISHDETRILFPLVAPIRNPLLSLGIESLTVWLMLSVVMLLLFFVALYEYPLGE